MNRRTVLSLAAGALAGAATTRPALAGPIDDVSMVIGQKGSWDSMVAPYGIDRGIFAKQKLELKIAYTAGGPDTISAVATGGADFGFGIGTTAVIAAFAKGAPIRIVAADFTGGSDLYFYAKPDSPINSFADMTGKSIGFTRVGSSTYMVVHALADQFKVTPNFVSTGEVAATLTQVMSGQVDVGWSVVPELLDLLQQKKIKMIARGSEAKLLGNQTIRVNVVNVNFLRDHRDVAVRFFKAYAATLDDIYRNFDRAVAFYAQFSGVPLEQAKALKAFETQKATALYPIAGFDQSMRDAVEYKFIPKPLEPDQAKAIFEILVPHR
jgi:NitT/TauT family transport system substrate-binding protein